MPRPVATLVTILLCLLLPLSSGAAQKTKIDSLLVVVSGSKADVMDRVLAGFIQAGLDVTDNSGSMVEADVGLKRNVLSGIEYTRVVRALVVPHDSSSVKVLITGVETRKDRDRSRRLRIDNKAYGEGEKVWCQMVAVAVLLDSSQVGPDARKEGKCLKDR